MKIQIIVLVFLCTFFTMSCSNEDSKINEDGLLTENELVAVLFDVHMLDATIATYNTVEKRQVKLIPECYDSTLFARHGCNDSIFRKSVEYYAVEGKIKDIYERVIDSLNLLRVQQEKNNYGK